MTSKALVPLALAAALAAAGCATLEPPLPQADPAIPAAWEAAPAKPGSVPVAETGWREFFVDPQLEALVARALEHNRDLRVAVLAVERARAIYRIQRAARVPSVGGGLDLTRSGGGEAPSVERYTASVGVGFELDLFGRVRSLSEAALRQYFATEAARRAAQLSLVAEVANAYLALAADRELLRVSRAALRTQEESFGLTQKRYELGAVSRLDLAQARTQVEQSRADAARYAGQAERDINALRLLVGADLDPVLLPEGFGERHVAGLEALPAGLPSEVLLRRPDVVQAEELLRAANADIGAARAAFFPSISLTGCVGTASDSLSGLFGGGSFAWSFLPRIDIPIFRGGALTAGLEAAKAERDMALAQYERTIQAGFREVADALALSRALAEQREAQEALVAAAAQAEELSRARYDAGRDSYLVLLDAQRTLYAAEQALVATRLAEQANRVTLYKVLGGGWREGAA